MTALEIVSRVPLPAYRLACLTYPQFNDSDLKFPMIASCDLSAWVTKTLWALAEAGEAEPTLPGPKTSLLTAFLPVTIASALRSRYTMRAPGDEFVIDNRRVLQAGKLRRRATALLHKLFNQRFKALSKSPVEARDPVNLAVRMALIPDELQEHPLPSNLELIFHATFFPRLAERISQTPRYVLDREGLDFPGREVAEVLLDSMQEKKLWTPGAAELRGGDRRVDLVRRLVRRGAYFAEGVRSEILANLYSRIFDTEAPRLTLRGQALYLFFTRPAPPTGGVVPIHSVFWHTFIHEMGRCREAIRRALDVAAAYHRDAEGIWSNMWANPNLLLHVISFAGCWPEVQAANRRGTPGKGLVELAEGVAGGRSPLEELEEREDTAERRQRILSNSQAVLEKAERLLCGGARLDKVLRSALWGLPIGYLDQLIQEHFDCVSEAERVRWLRAVLVEHRDVTLNHVATQLRLNPKPFYGWVRTAIGELLRRALWGRANRRGRKPVPSSR